jgi:hypothetical protein
MCAWNDELEAINLYYYESRSAVRGDVAKATPIHRHHYLYHLGIQCAPTWNLLDAGMVKVRPFIL